MQRLADYGYSEVLSNKPAINSRKKKAVSITNRRRILLVLERPIVG